MKNRIISYMSGAVCLIILLVGIRCIGQKKVSEDIYEVNGYQGTEGTKNQVFRQFCDLLYNCEPDQILYQRDTIINNTFYHQYASNYVTINVSSMNNKTQSTIGDYNIIYNDKKVTFNEHAPQYAESIRIYYVDINKDSKKDIVLIGEPYSGSNNTYYWIHAVDLESMQEILIFSSETRCLTSEQEEQLKDLLAEDTRFQKVFPDLERMDYASRPIIDRFGNVYCSLGLGKGENEDIGEILVLFNYNADTYEYDVTDYVYMRKEIY